jgi:hypothetical protein
VSKILSLNDAIIHDPIIIQVTGTLVRVSWDDEQLWRGLMMMNNSGWD